MPDAQVNPDETKPGEPELKPTSLRKLFQFADGYDKIAIAVGTVCAFCGGAGFPLMTVVLADAFDTMGDADPDVDYTATMRTAVETVLLLVAGVSLVAAWVSYS